MPVDSPNLEGKRRIFYTRLNLPSSPSSPRVSEGSVTKVCVYLRVTTSAQEKYYDKTLDRKINLLENWVCPDFILREGYPEKKESHPEKIRRNE